MTQRIAMVVSCLIAIVGCGKATQEEPSSQPAQSNNVLAVDKPTDVESVLKTGKWQSRSGLSNGVAWQFADGGRVLIHDGSEVDESHQWKVLSRNESERKIRVKFWNPDETEHREWEFTFGGSNSPATVKSFIYEGSRMKDSDEYLRYPIN